jgi:hypothetical protein
MSMRFYEEQRRMKGCRTLGERSKYATHIAVEAVWALRMRFVQHANIAAKGR